MKTKQSLPPKWADRLLAWFCKDEVLENVQGDLHEIYQKRIRKIGAPRANLLFIGDVLGLLRPRLIKKLEVSDHANQYGVFKNYLKTSVRCIKQNSLFSCINVVGLAISMSVGILMIAVLSELQTFDDFHEKKDRIYRVTTSRKALFHGEAEYYASASHWIARQIQDQIPNVEQVLVLDRDLTADLKIDTKGIAVSGYYASASFFDVLSFELKKGNPATALHKPGAIVLTESTAKKLFGDSDPIGKTVIVEANPDFNVGIITGIIEDPPFNSHLHFEALVSIGTIENSMEPRRRYSQNNPGTYAQSYIYIVLTEGTNIADIELAMNTIMANHNSKGTPNKLALQPMAEFVTTDAGYSPGPTFSQQRINVMIGLTILVLFSACFNYTNLSLVRALRRSKEISVRKITGATRLHIFSQFMTEAILLSLIALALGVGLFLLIKPEFLNISNLMAGGRQMFALDLAPVHLFYFLLLAIVVGASAGFLPALYLSKLKASALLNGANKIKLFSGVSVKQTLITCQIALSIGLIMCGVMVYKQYNYALNFELGYNTKNIVNIKVGGDYAQFLENEYAKMADVIETSRSSVILGTRDGMMADAKAEDHSDTIMFSCNYIDHKYLDMHGFELIAGTGFLPPLKDGNMQTIIVNEAFLKELKLGSPEEAIGKQIWYFDEIKLKIQGVVKDFTSKSLDAQAPEAFGFLNGPVDENGILGLKIASNHLLATMEKLEKTYKKFDPIHPFQATFYDDQIASTYQTSKTTYTIVSFLAFLAISISTLGLLGLAVYTIETRMKELSIRKIFGAGVKNLIFLLARSFMVMITIAAMIAIPVTRYIVDSVVLQDFVYKTEIGLIELFSGFVIVFFISAMTVAWQVRTAAVQNPADLLRDQ